jgi:hypothetical protein
MGNWWWGVIWDVWVKGYTKEGKLRGEMREVMGGGKLSKVKFTWADVYVNCMRV